MTRRIRDRFRDARHTWAGLALAAIACPLTLSPPDASAAAAPSAAKAWDFNGDGRRDLAVGVAGSTQDAGAVDVLLATKSGPATRSAIRITQDSPGVPGTATPHDQFGATLASGDFNGDGYADLAVAAPGDDTATDSNVGSVTVLFGSRNGITTHGARALGRPKVVFGEPDPEDADMGFKLAAADYNRDGHADLVASVATQHGGLLIYPGRASGIATQPTKSIAPGFGLPNEGGAFPSALASGDLDGNGVPDLAVGWMEDQQAKGAVVVIYGSRSRGLDFYGRNAPKPQVWTEDSLGVKGEANEFDGFGSAVGIGDVTGDGRNDLVAATLQQPTENRDALRALHVLPGTSRGVSAKDDQYLTYSDLSHNPKGTLGVELAVGDLNGNSIADVAVTTGGLAGGPTGMTRWGGVLIAYGSRRGLGAHRIDEISQDSSGVGGARTSPGDYWGDGIRVRDLGNSKAEDLIVADPYEDATAQDSGMVTVLWGSNNGISGHGSRTLTLGTPGIPGGVHAGDRFGSAL